MSDITKINLGDVLNILNNLNKLLNTSNNDNTNFTKDDNNFHPFVGKFCIFRTYSAGVHAGILVSTKNTTEAHVQDAYRIWKWENGGLSLSALAENGIKGGRINKCSEIYLNDVIEIIPATNKLKPSLEKFIEDN